MSLPDGRYLISVLADGYKIDGAHFTVPLARSRASSRSSCSPIRCPTRPCGARSSRTSRDHQRDLAIAERARPGRLRRSHQRRPRRGADRRLRQPALHRRTRAKTRTRTRSRFDSLDADMLPVADRRNRRQVRQRRRRPPDDPEPRHQPLRVVGHAAGRADLDPDDDPRGQPRLGRLGDGGLDRLRHRVRRRPASRSRAHLRLRPADDSLERPATRSRPAARARSRASSTAINVLHPAEGRLVRLLGRHHRHQGRPPDRPAVARRCPTSGRGDTAVWVGRGDADGSVRHPGVPDGNYTLSWWDEPQDYILKMINVTVSDGETVDMGNLPLAGWWTKYDGLRLQRHQPQRRQGSRRAGRPELHADAAQARELADGPRHDRGHHRPVRPLLLRERLPARRVARSWRPTTTATTRPASPTRPTTSRPRRRSRARASTSASCRSSASAARIDWGVHAYDPTGRQRRRSAERRHRRHGQLRHDPQRARPAVRRGRGLAARRLRRAGRALRAGRLRHDAGAPCDADGRYELDADGSYAQGKLLNTYVTETWERPTGCAARDVDGNPLVPGVDAARARPRPGHGRRVPLEAPAGRPVRPLPDRPGHARRQLRRGGRRQLRLRRRLLQRHLDATDPAAPDVRRRQTFEPLPARRLPRPRRRSPTTRRATRSTRSPGEEDINIGNGDQIVPQVPPPACAGALHTVDLAGDGDGRLRPVVGDGRPNGVPVGVTVPASDAGRQRRRSSTSAARRTRAQPKPLLRHQARDRSTTASRSCPMFNVFTDVPMPGSASAA